MTFKLTEKLSSDEKLDKEISLKEIINLIFDSKWIIITSVVIFSALGVLYAMLATPLYRANATIQVEEQSRGGVSSLVSAQLGEIFAVKSSTPTEMVIMKSRMILSKTVDRFHLNIVAVPHIIPIVGKLINRIKGEEHSIEVSHFETPTNDDLDKVMYEISVIDEYSQSYVLKKKGKVILHGVSGELVSKNGYSIFVDSFVSTDGASFSIKKRNDLDSIKWLSDNLSVSEIGKLTGIVEISFVGVDPDRIESILNDIQQNYFLQSAKRNSSDAEHSLKFLKSRLPAIKKELDRKESILNAYRQKNETIDLPMEAKAKLDTMVSLDAQLNELIFKESEISQKYTKDHPAYIALLDKRRALLDRKTKLNKEIKNLPQTQRQILRMSRDVEVDQQIYVQILNEIQELNVVKAGAGGNARILDHARTSVHPVKPRKVLACIVFMMFGFMVGCGFVIAKATIRLVFNSGIKDPKDFQSLALPVYAIVPMSKLQKKINKKSLSKNKCHDKSGILADSNVSDESIAALQELESNLRFAILGGSGNITMLSGPTEKSGKTFIGSNLAAILAMQGKKVLLIDADMSQGEISKLYGLHNEVGLCNYLIDNMDKEQIIQRSTIQSLDIITHGQVPPNPVEILALPAFEKLIKWCSEHYDHVLIDTREALVSDDAVVIGKYADTVLLVARYGKTLMQEIYLVQQKFHQAKIKVNGVIFNGSESK